MYIILIYRYIKLPKVNLSPIFSWHLWPLFFNFFLIHFQLPLELPPASFSSFSPFLYFICLLLCGIIEQHKLCPFSLLHLSNCLLLCRTSEQHKQHSTTSLQTSTVIEINNNFSFFLFLLTFFFYFDFFFWPFPPIGMGQRRRQRGR